MWLSELTVHHCRIINEASLNFCPDLNFFFGLNGSGKTSLIEALSVLSLGRSFRTSRISETVSYDHDHLLVSALVHDADDHNIRIGIKKNSKQTIIRVNKKTIKSQSELSRILPITVIHPLSHQLITEGSSKRRNFIDWIAFYQFPEFHPLWKQYTTILKQRNASLKQPKLDYAIDYLTHELCKLQKPLHSFRQQALKNLLVTLEQSTPDYLADYIPDISVTTGLPLDVSLDQDSLLNYYKSKLDYEKKRGRTIKGVHCADLEVSLHSKPASISASRGQTKIMAIILHIAQSLAINRRGIISLDDLSAEIDNNNYKKILTYISCLDRQVFITDTEKRPITGLDFNAKLFHVEHGSINAI